VHRRRGILPAAADAVRAPRVWAAEQVDDDVRPGRFVARGSLHRTCDVIDDAHAHLFLYQRGDAGETAPKRTCTPRALLMMIAVCGPVRRCRVSCLLLLVSSPAARKERPNGYM
jgi:hypothetical protein